MNQRGEITLTCVFIVVIMSGLLLVCTMELQRSYNLLVKRTQLFLCVKETKGELSRHLTIMGRTNWALKNIQRAQIFMIFIPGLQGAALSAGKVRKTIKYYQLFELVSHLKNLNRLRTNDCPMDPRLLITPFKLKGSGYVRDLEGAVKLRKKKWKYVFVKVPYVLELSIQEEDLNSLNPRLDFLVQERAGKLSSLFSSL